MWAFTKHSDLRLSGAPRSGSGMFTATTVVFAAGLLTNWTGAFESLFSSAEMVVLALLALMVLWEATGLRYIPNNYVGIVEKLWSRSGSIAEGSIIATNDEAGFQAEVLRGGFHFGLWRWQ